MRVGIIGLQHESNTFAATPTTFDRFEQDYLLTGGQVESRMRDTHHELAGFLAGLSREALEAVPIFFARALPAGTIEAAAFDRLLDMLWNALDQAGQLDGLLVAPHGAAVSEEHRDADGYWLTELRRRVGKSMPIVCTIDPHANASQRMIDACDATIAYRTNPHIDQYQRGLEAATLVAGTVRGELDPVQALAMPPMAINIERQRTAQRPCLDQYEVAEDVRRRKTVLSVSIVLGFPYADVREMGSSVIVVTDRRRAVPEPMADELARCLWDNRKQFAGHMIGVDEALGMADDWPAPALLLDMGDNVGGGSPGDGTLIAHEIHRRRLGDALVTIFDPESVTLAGQAGVGQRVTLRIGGKTDDRHGPPLEAEVEVIGLYEGTFDEPKPRHGGMTQFDMGPTAVVRSAHGLTVMLTSKRLIPVSLGQWSACEIDPARYRLIIAKGVHAPVAAYEEISSTMIRVNTPGVTTADMQSLYYQHRRRPLFPFE